MDIIDDTIYSGSAEERALWESAVTGALPDVEMGRADGHSASCSHVNSAEKGMIRLGAKPGTGISYFGRASTRRVFYRALNGSYWDIVYRHGRLTGVEPWHSWSSALQQPEELRESLGALAHAFLPSSPGGEAIPVTPAGPV